MKKLLSFLVIFLLGFSQTFALSDEDKLEILKSVNGFNQYLDKIDLSKIDITVGGAENSIGVSIQDDFIKAEYLEEVKNYLKNKENGPTLRKDLNGQKLLPESMRIQFELADGKIKAKFLTKKDFVEYKKLRKGKTYPTLESVKEQFPNVSSSTEIKFKETEKEFVEKIVEKIKQEPKADKEKAELKELGSAPNPESFILKKDCRVIGLCSKEEAEEQKKERESNNQNETVKKKKNFVPEIKEHSGVKLRDSK